MHFISHRGNINGKDVEKENHPDQVLYCLNKGYEVEIDVWYIDNKFYLGHDSPQYHVSLNLLMNTKLWAHCKNVEALTRVCGITTINAFYIDKEAFTLTTNRYIWSGPGCDCYYPPHRTICAIPEDERWKKDQVELDRIVNFAGICSDNIYNYREHVTNIRR